MNVIAGFEIVVTYAARRGSPERRIQFRLDMDGRLELDQVEGEYHKQVRGRIQTEAWGTMKNLLFRALKQLGLFDGAIAGTQAVPRRGPRDQIYVQTLGAPPQQEIWRHYARLSALRTTNPVLVIVEAWRQSMLEPHANSPLQIEDWVLLKDTEAEMKAAEATKAAADRIAEEERRMLRATDAQARLGTPLRLAYEWQGNGPRPGVKQKKTVLDAKGRLEHTVDNVLEGGRKQVDAKALDTLYAALCSAGFPEMAAERAVCLPGEGHYRLELTFQSETVELEIPSGEHDQTPGWPVVKQFLRDLRL